jgi:hypothetical protein
MRPGQFRAGRVRRRVVELTELVYLSDTAWPTPTPSQRALPVAGTVGVHRRGKGESLLVDARMASASSRWAALAEFAGWTSRAPG